MCLIYFIYALFTYVINMSDKEASNNRMINAFQLMTSEALLA
jgi:hypothetical protein